MFTKVPLHPRCLIKSLVFAPKILEQKSFFAPKMFEQKSCFTLQLSGDNNPALMIGKINVVVTIPPQAGIEPATFRSSV